MEKCSTFGRIRLHLLMRTFSSSSKKQQIQKSSIAALSTFTTPKKHHTHNSLARNESLRQIPKRSYSSKPKLESVGIFDPAKTEGRYETGQLFLHKVFGYRGVILFPWSAQLYERDKSDHTDKNRESDEASSGKQVIAKTLTYYQALVDARDCPHINAQSEAVTFLGSNERGQSLYTIPGLDYVSQDDVLPYTTVEKIPIHHDLFDKFLTYDPSSSKLPQATETLVSWQEKNHMCLELSKVHQETTSDIRVTAMPFFLGAKDTQNMQEFWWRYLIRIENFSNHTVQLRERHWKTYEVSTGRLATISGRGVVGMWRYCIRIENLGATRVRLRERHWRIISNGSVKTVRGRGVIGREPVLSKEQPAFQYSSHVSLHSPTGHMWGMFRMERPDGTQFDVRIPAYALESKMDSNSGNGSNNFRGS